MYSESVTNTNYIELTYFVLYWDIDKYMHRSNFRDIHILKLSVLFSGAKTINEVNKLSHFTNLRLLTKTDNRSRFNKVYEIEDA